MLKSLTFILLASASLNVVVAQTPRKSPVASNRTISSIVREIDARNIEASIRKLVSFGTRNTLSEQNDPKRGIGAARDWLVANAPLRALFGATYMANPDRPTKEPLLLLLEEVLAAGIAAAVILPADDGPGAGLDATAQLVLDVMREAAGRAAAGDAAAIATAEAFLEGGLHFDADAARRAVFPA